MKNLFLTVFFFSLVVGVYAQTATDVLHLRSGSTIAGTLVRYDAEEGVVAFTRAEDNLTQTYPLEAVESLRQLPSALAEGEAWRITLPLAERKRVTSLVALKDGTTREGVITDYSDKGVITIRLASGTLVMVNDENVESVTYEMPKPRGRDVRRDDEPVVVPPAFTKEPAVYEFRERGWFNATSFAFSFGKREREIQPFFGPPDEFDNRVEQSAIGFNVQHVTGFQFSRMLGVGLGASYDAYDLEDGESVLTVFAHYRGYLTKTIVAPYVAVNGGYGFAVRNESQGVVTAEGGWMFHPELGVRLGATDKANFTLGLGYRLQDAYYVQERPFNGNIEYRNVTYQRFLFSLGLLF